MKRETKQRLRGSAYLALPSIAMLHAFSPAYAADNTQQAQPNFTDIIVTAQKKAETLQSVPISISAMTSETLDKKGVQSVQQIYATTPSITTTPAYTSNDSLIIYMRGIGSVGPQQPYTEPGVGLYQDGYYIARPSGLNIDLGELERVEVLRGPQGTLYGFNTAGGAVNLISKKPKGEWGLRQDIEFGSFGHFRSLTVVDLPTWNNISAKVSLLKSDFNGWVKNIGPSHNFGESHAKGVKVQLRWDNGGPVQADYFFSYARSNSSSAQYYQNPQFNDRPITIYDPTGTVGTTYIYSNADQRRDTTYRPFDVPLTPSTLETHALTLAWEASENLTLKSLTGYVQTDTSSSGNFADALDAGGGVPLVYTFGAYPKSNQFTQEVQLLADFPDAGVTAVAGAFFFREVTNDSQFGIIQVPFYSPFTTNVREDFNVKKRSLAGFGQVSWKPIALDGKLNITLGARYTADYREVTDSNPATGAVIGPNKGRFNKFTPAFSVSYDVTRDILVYAKYSTGYRAGGVNPCLIGGCLQERFEPETVIATEVGLKSTWFDRRLTANLALFSNRYKDMQIGFFNGKVFGAGSISGSFNAASARIRGLEADLEFRPVDPFRIGASYSYLDASLRRVDVLPGTNFDGSVNPASPFAVGDNIASQFILPFTPKHSFDINGDLRIIGSDGVDLTFFADYRYQSSVFSQSTYGPAVAGRDFGRTPAYGIFNTRLTLKTELRNLGSVSASLWAKNLLDNHYLQSVFAAGGDNISVPFVSSSQVYGQPRTIGLTLSYRH